MVFSSITFLCYFLPCFLCVYYLSSKAYKNYVILAFSIFFYSWGAPSFLFILMGSTIIDFFLVQKMSRMTDDSNRKWALTASLTLNLGLLAYFKYANFFVDNINGLLSSLGFSDLSWTSIALPIGISFYTFQTLTYSIDVYKGKNEPLEKLSDYLLYIMLFPQMIAGPIIRYNTIAQQITDRVASYDDRLMGFYRFVIGLSKKVLIANVMAEKADAIMGSSNLMALDSSTAWIGLLAYTFQIYFDFSGYSDMAIGIGRMIGFKFPENFNNPYSAGSITEFWRRWHITLGDWMRDYLYIPLGGNRVSTSRMYCNLWIVFLLSGLWHGASWNFILWGVFHGSFLVLDRLFLMRFYQAIGRPISTLITFILVMLGWVVFRIESLGDAMTFYQRLFAFDFHRIQFSTDKLFFFALILCFFFSFFTTIPKYGIRVQHNIFEGQLSKSWSIAFFISSLLLFCLALATLATNSFNPFIYFRF